ncbi:hypothetical protein NC653_034604 [Populus alba x Populus x berolinensis]|uniref:Uncharacterized protein n=1 Tax=Populus alba x Populus x berolinensis TaxID=444605 RepID=A0AAD6LMX4_9ROSI|nr:hypothetical protein NC653_034604 [Populus alba x Populus x berolinensis]
MLSKRHIALAMSAQAKVSLGVWPATKRKQPMRHVVLGLSALKREPKHLVCQRDDSSIQEGGLQSRSGSFLHKDPLGKSNVPALATAGDQDLICPPEARQQRSFQSICLLTEFLESQVVCIKLTVI